MPQDSRSNSPTPQQASRVRDPDGEVGQDDARLAADRVEGEPRAFERAANPDPFELEDELLADRPRKGPVDREHGPKTKGRNKQIVSGKPYG